MFAYCAPVSSYFPTFAEVLIPPLLGLASVEKLTPKPASFDPLVAEFQVMFPLPSKSSLGKATTSGQPSLSTSPATSRQLSRVSITVSPSVSGMVIPSAPPLILSI